jgi:hypothetical protein
MFGDGLWILVLEGVLALGLLVFIVWWTLPSAPRPPASAPIKADPDRDQGAAASEHKPPPG